MLEILSTSIMHAIDSIYGNLSCLLTKHTSVESYACNGTPNTHCTLTF